MSQHDNVWWAAYREKNRLWLRVYANRWYHKTKHLRKAALLGYYMLRRDHFRQKAAETNWRRRLAILAILGSKCVRCGFDDPRALQVDHVNGGGSQHRKSLSHSWGSKFWEAELSERRAAYQLLCANCNWIKRYENKELFKCRQ